jgi:hypothetical protein
LFGYVCLSNTYEEYSQYYLHLELIKEKHDEESFILVKEGYTTNGFYLDYLKNRFRTSNQIKPFDKTIGFRYPKETKRDYFWDRYNKIWIERAKKSLNNNFFSNQVFVIAYPSSSSLDDRLALISQEVSLKL